MWPFRPPSLGMLVKNALLLSLVGGRSPQFGDVNEADGGARRGVVKIWGKSRGRSFD